jgi:hypothetical protein
VSSPDLKSLVCHCHYLASSPDIKSYVCHYHYLASSPEDSIDQEKTQSNDNGRHDSRSGEDARQ